MARPLHPLFKINAKKLGRVRKAMLNLATGQAAGGPKSAATPARQQAKRRREPLPPGPRANDGNGQWHNFLYSQAASMPGGIGHQHSYAVYLPAGYPAQNLPVLVLLHGCQQAMRDIARGTRMNLLADAKGFAVVYVQQSRQRNPGRCWRWFSPAGEDDADAIAGIVQATVARYEFDAGRVYAAGMSAGAGMAAMLALRHPTLISALAMHSGAVVGAANSPRSGLSVMRHGATSTEPQRLLDAFRQAGATPPRMPTIILHGLRDEVVIPRNAMQLATQFLHWNQLSVRSGQTTILAKGSRNEYRRIDYGDGRRTLLRLCLVKELGHAWSGGDDTLPFHAANGPDASALIWRFFARHTKN